LPDLRKRRRLEITTMHQCTINCFFCPQKVYRDAYKSTENLTLQHFKDALYHTPKDVAIEFAGFSEPFLNPECLKMIQYADSEGYKIIVDTTLTGLDPIGIKELTKIPFLAFSLHLPDNKNNARIPINQTYKDTLTACLSSIKVDCFSSMNDTFVSHGRAGNCTDAKAIYKTGKLLCQLGKYRYPSPVMLPNGTLVICCMDYGLTTRLGNIYQTDYDTLIANVKQAELCRHCVYADSPLKSLVRNTVARANGKILRMMN